MEQDRTKRLIELVDEMKSELTEMAREINDAKCQDYGHTHHDGKCVYCDLEESK